MLEILIFIYFLIAIPFYGLFFASLQRNWPTIAKEYYIQDILYSIFFGVVWPVSWICLVFSSKPLKGLKFW